MENMQGRVPPANLHTFAGQQTDRFRNTTSARARLCKCFHTLKCICRKWSSLWYDGHPLLHPHSIVQSKQSHDRNLPWFLFKSPFLGFFAVLIQKRVPQWEAGVGRGQRCPTRLLGGLLPTTAETTEIFVGHQQRNRPKGKGKGSQ